MVRIDSITRSGEDRHFSYAGVVTVICEYCGRRADGDEAPVTWSAAVERGRIRRYCEECSRTNIRSMEAKLDSEWW